INGFGSPSFFVLSDSYGATTMNAIEGKIEDVNDKTIVGTPLKTLDMHMSGSYCVGISRFLVPNDFDPNTDVNKPSPDERLTFMSIWKFLSFCILYQLLVILFGTLLGILISTVTTRKGVAIAFGILMGMFLTLIHVDKGILRYIHAGTYMNPVRMLGGTARVTTLNGVTVLSLYTIVISLFIVWITKRQDISC
ncbi:MAG TPA: hypothetical protein VHP81_04535, partial [Lachnospiraceae bacterium]|nr:hypothetical protein [Lachnospiraceae bacterium]